MRKEVFEIMSKDGRTKLHAVKWLPDDEVCQAVLQITHGMIEFIDRYEGIAEYLTKQGYVVAGHDHLGHGESVLSQEDWGYFAPEHPSDILVEDIHEVRRKLQAEYAGMPYFMMGHSMGSYMLRKYLAIHGSGLNGAVIIGTGSVSDLTTGAGLFATKLLAKIYGWRHHSEFIRKLSFGGPYKKFDMTGTDPSNSWLTKDVEIVRQYANDPRCGFTFTLNGYLGLMEAVRFDNQQENIDRIPANLPLLLASGEDDPVGDFGKGVKRVYKQYKEAGIEDVTCKLYPNDRHEILNETDREIVYNDIFAWLEAHRLR